MSIPEREMLVVLNSLRVSDLLLAMESALSSHFGHSSDMLSMLSNQRLVDTYCDAWGLGEDTKAVLLERIR